MARFRQNHSRPAGSGKYMARLLVIIVAIFGLVLWGLQGFMKKEEQRETDSRPQSYRFEGDLSASERKYYIPVDNRKYIPESTVPSVHHNYFSLGYAEALEQSLWVCYELTKASIQVPNVERFDWYMSDEAVESGSAIYHDYSDRRYTRGHLAPAGDMAFNRLAMKESFLMSNMSPQIRNFNAGVWNELELTVRDWAYSYGKLAVCTGPVFLDDQIERIGRNRVGVPHAFYKAVIDVQSGTSIAFIIPHAVSELPLSSYAMTVDKLESEIGINLFSGYYKHSDQEARMESIVDMDYWPFKEGRFQARINKWNKD